MYKWYVNSNLWYSISIRHIIFKRCNNWLVHVWQRKKIWILYSWCQNYRVHFFHVDRMVMIEDRKIPYEGKKITWLKDWTLHFWRQLQRIQTEDFFMSNINYQKSFLGWTWTTFNFRKGRRISINYVYAVLLVYCFSWSQGSGVQLSPSVTCFQAFWMMQVLFARLVNSHFHLYYCWWMFIEKRLIILLYQNSSM